MSIEYIVKTVYIVYSRFYQLASLYVYTIYMSIVKTVYTVYSRFYLAFLALNMNACRYVGSLVL